MFLERVGEILPWTAKLGEDAARTMCGSAAMLSWAKAIKLLAALFDISTPKDDIGGSQVARVYYEEKDLERIRRYCQKDTLTVAQLLLKYKGKDLIKEENIEFV